MSDSNNNLQQLSQRRLARLHQHCIHALIAAYFNLMSKLNGITPFSQHVDEVRFVDEMKTNSISPKVFLSSEQEISFPVISNRHVDEIFLLLLLLLGRSKS